MSQSINSISLASLSIMLLPALLVLGIMLRWSMPASNALYALMRMLVQLLIVGYFLAFIFASDNALFIIGILGIMLFAASWIALNASQAQRKKLFLPVLLSTAAGAGSLLLLVTQGVLQLEPWYSPQYMIPLAGMLLANTMNSISLAAERMQAEINYQKNFTQARNVAFQAAMIPVVNSLFAVGIVSLPGMMTGQILAGVEPLIAARYQIMVMLMIFASSGIGVACFLQLSRRQFSPADPAADPTAAK